MLLRRIARPLLSAVFIGQGVETLRNPKVTLDAAQTAVTTLQTLPDPVGSKIPSDPETVARINAAVQVGGGVLLATGKLPRIASAALRNTAKARSPATRSGGLSPIGTPASNMAE